MYLTIKPEQRPRGWGSSIRTEDNEAIFAMIATPGICLLRKRVEEIEEFLDV